MKRYAWRTTWKNEYGVHRLRRSFRAAFARPEALASDAPFARHPIPPEVWQAATEAAAGSELSVAVTVARDGQAFGPITQTWTVADGRLDGCVYYQSYYTDLVQNSAGALGPESLFGAATLAVHPDGVDPMLVAGRTCTAPAALPRGARAVGLRGKLHGVGLVHFGSNVGASRSARREKAAPEPTSFETL